MFNREALKFNPDGSEFIIQGFDVIPNASKINPLVLRIHS